MICVSPCYRRVADHLWPRRYDNQSTLLKAAEEELRSVGARQGTRKAAVGNGSSEDVDQDLRRELLRVEQERNNLVSDTQLRETCAHLLVQRKRGHVPRA